LKKQRPSASVFILRPMEQKIICDTNIWYGIAEGKIDKSSLEGLNLVLTFNTLVEFACTDLLYKKPLFVREAIRASLLYSNIKDLRSSFDVISETLVQNHENDLSEGFFLWEEGRYYTRMKDKDIYGRMSNEMIAAINNRQNEIQSVCDHINNEQLPKIRNNLDNKGDKKTHAARNMVKPTIEFYKFLLSLKNENLAFVENPETKKIDTLIQGTIAFFKDLELRSDRKFRRNDWFDMMNLAYIDNEKTLYWTKDGPWKNLIRQAKIDSILFYPN
jgi:hypothetical protein